MKITAYAAILLPTSVAADFLLIDHNNNRLGKDLSFGTTAPLPLELRKAKSDPEKTVIITSEQELLERNGSLVRKSKPNDDDEQTRIFADSDEVNLPDLDNFGFRVIEQADGTRLFKINEECLISEGKQLRVGSCKGNNAHFRKQLLDLPSEFPTKNKPRKTRTHASTISESLLDLSEPAEATVYAPPAPRSAEAAETEALISKDPWLKKAISSIKKRTKKLKRKALIRKILRTKPEETDEGDSEISRALRRELRAEAAHRTGERRGGGDSEEAGAEPRGWRPYSKREAGLSEKTRSWRFQELPARLGLPAFWQRAKRGRDGRVREGIAGGDYGRPAFPGDAAGDEPGEFGGEDVGEAPVSSGGGYRSPIVPRRGAERPRMASVQPAQPVQQTPVQQANPQVTPTALPPAETAPQPVPANQLQSSAFALLNIDNLRMISAIDSLKHEVEHLASKVESSAASTKDKAKEGGLFDAVTNMNPVTRGLKLI